MSEEIELMPLKKGLVKVEGYSLEDVMKLIYERSMDPIGVSRLRDTVYFRDHWVKCRPEKSDILCGILERGMYGVLGSVTKSRCLGMCVEALYRPASSFFTDLNGVISFDRGGLIERTFVQLYHYTEHKWDEVVEVGDD